MDEMELPQMPADLNARLMQRLGEENHQQQKHRRMLWPWIAAACVAAVIAVYLTPPKDTTSPLTPLQEARGTTEAENVVEAPVNNAEQPAGQPVQTPVKRIVAKVQPKKSETPSVMPQEKSAVTEQLLAQETKPAEKKVDNGKVAMKIIF